MWLELVAFVECKPNFANGFDEFEKLVEQIVESTKFDLFYDVWVEKTILEALGEFSTRIWISPVSRYTYGF